MTQAFNNTPPTLFVQVQREVTLPEQFTLLLGRDKAAHLEGPARWYFQIEALRIDICTGELGRGRGGKAYLSEYATLSELVQTAFGLYKAFLEHEARETFQWNGRRVFGPHMDVRAVWEVAERFDARNGPTSLPTAAHVSGAGEAKREQKHSGPTSIERSGSTSLQPNQRK